MMKEIIEQQLKEVQKIQRDIYEKALRNNATPPITGEITSGKIKWRGIRKVTRKNIDSFEEWLEQRGVRISEKIIFTASIK